MLKTLKFVQGAVAKKGLVQSLTHFKIEDGKVRSYNGSLALCSPIDLDINCTPKAEPFVRAIANCKDTVTMNMTPAGRLSIKSGAFRAYIETIEEETPHVEPEGELFEIDGEALLQAFKTVTPFIGNDASRPWCNGVLLKECSAYATNNVTIIEYWVGTNFPMPCNIPRDAIREMVRINEPPLSAQISERSITFHYEDGRWVRSAMLALDWPDVSPILNAPSNPQPLEEEVYEALEAIKPFVDKMERVYIGKGEISSTLIDGEGAHFKIEGLEVEGVYALSILNLLKDVVTKIDLSTYPKPCLFFGEKLRGAIIGMRN